ncbi:hypothetical protein JMUB6875_70720 [Nocardia sp. JMUB6875]
MTRRTIRHTELFFGAPLPPPPPEPLPPGFRGGGPDGVPPCGRRAAGCAPDGGRVRSSAGRGRAAVPAPAPARTARSETRWVRSEVAARDM